MVLGDGPDMAYYSFAQAIDRSKDLFQIYNLGNHQSEELMTLISLLEEELGEKALIEFKPMQLGDMVDTFADIAERRYPPLYRVVPQRVASCEMKKRLEGLI